MVKKINFNDKQKFLLVIILMLIIIILPNVKANMCDNTFNHYKDYIEDTLVNSFHEIKNDLKELNNNMTYDDKKIVSNLSFNESNLELIITSEVNFSEINLLDFIDDPLIFIEAHLNKLKINDENFSISSDYFDEYYDIFKETIFFDIFKDLNITHVNFNGTEYEINSNKENIKNIINSSNIIDYLSDYPNNFSMDFEVRIQNDLNNCTKNITLDFEFYNGTIIVYSTIGSHSIKMTAEFEENSILIFFEYEDKILTFNVILDEYEMRIKAEFSNKIEQDFDENTDTPIVVNSSYDIINVNINNNISTIPKIDLGNLINLTTGKGSIPKITINASNANNVIVNIPATNITSSNVSWDGIIEAPTIVNVSIPATQGKSRTQSIAIKVGFSGGKLTFSKAVKLTFPGEAGKNVAYLSEGNFNEINDVCGSNNQNWADSNLNEGKECYINNGSDLIIWTKHFTEFVTYTESDVSSQRISRGGLCTTSWTCSAWSNCINGVQTRTCSYPDNFCTPSSTKPEETRFCSIQKPGIALNEPEDEIKAGLGLGAIIGGSASLYWILSVLVIIIITLIVILIKSKKEENKELKEKTEENEKVEESENNNLEDKKEVKISKEKDKKIIKKPKKVKKNKEKSKV